MKRFATVLVAGVVVFGIGCAEDSPPDDPYSLTFKTGNFTVPMGDSFECFYTDVITERELAVRGAFGQQGVGGHHITVYYTEIMQEPNHHPCDDGEMADWRMVGGTGGNDGDTGDADLRLPDGLGIKIPEGVQLVMQVHYINLTDSIREANDTVTLELAPAEELDDFVNQFVVFDGSFNVPPGEVLTRSTTCEVTETVQLVKLLGHMHEWGKYYSLEKVDAQGNTLEMLYEQTTWHEEFASNPPVTTYDKNTPLVLEKGTLLRQTCEWWNTEDYALLFPREMCVAFGFYYPDRGEQLCDPIVP